MKIDSKYVGLNLTIALTREEVMEIQDAHAALLDRTRQSEENWKNILTKYSNVAELIIKETSFE
jgi:hypothetical protein